MRIHYFQHVAFEGLEMIQFWATKNGYPTQGTAFFEADPVLPDHTSYDALIVMGGPMGVYDGEKHLWLEGEKQHIR